MKKLSKSLASLSGAIYKRCAQKVGPVIEKVKELLIKADVRHFDETGIKALGKLFWVHNSSNSSLTYQTVNSKRGSEGMDDNGVLTNFTGLHAMTVGCHIKTMKISSMLYVAPIY